MNQKILVIGGAGFIGAPIAKQLLADGFQVRVLVRNPEKAKLLLGGQVELAAGDFEDQEVLEKALEGCDGVNISIPWQFEASVVQAVTSILIKEGRKKVHVTYISGTTVLPENRGYTMIDEKLKAEAILMQSGVAYTIFKPSWFMDALAFFVRDGRATLFGKQSQAYYFLSVADFARAVSRAHQADAPANQSVVLNGPQPVMIADALQQYCDMHHPGVKVSLMPIWFGKILAALYKSPAMKDFVQMMAYFEKSPRVSEPAPGGLNPLAPAKTLQEWLLQE